MKKSEFFLLTSEIKIPQNNFSLSSSKRGIILAICLRVCLFFKAKESANMFATKHVSLVPLKQHNLASFQKTK